MNARHLFCALAICLCLGILSASADVPHCINFQGILTDTSGNPITGTRGIQFSFYTDSTAGTQLWTETQPLINISNGFFDVHLGQITALGDAVFNNPEVWLGIAVGGDPEMTPRTRIVSVGYSYRVGTVDGAGGGTISSDLIVQGRGNFGSSNTNTGTYAFVAGQDNIAHGNHSTVGGGHNNTADDTAAVVSGGSYNIALGKYSVVAGGGGPSTFNYAFSSWSTVGGGRQNTAIQEYATVGGGTGNTASDSAATVAGGRNNRARGRYSVIAGGGGVSAADSNSAMGNYSAIGGGRRNFASGSEATVGGGVYNTASSYQSTVGGGNGNTASGSDATVGGGWNNTASNYYATVGGGDGNTASGSDATVGGGWSNTASNDYATVGGGYVNTASGSYSAIPGGYNNSAIGRYSFAAGRRAKANHTGAFVWGDSTNSDITTSGVNQIRMRASGGTIIYSNSAMSTGVTLAAGGGSWSSVSDSTLKCNIRMVNTKNILDKVAQLPIKQWSYKSQDPSIEHIGPMAQDFWKLFHLGEDSLGISTIDPDGIALAAIQELQKQNAALQERVTQLEKQLGKMSQNQNVSVEQVNLTDKPQ